VNTRGRAISDVLDERDRQEALGDERPGWRTCADPLMPDNEKAVVLGEEYGEVCRALLDDDASGLRRELAHVAAVAVAWMESLP
jgi:hypothetical protein